MQMALKSWMCLVLDICMFVCSCVPDATLNFDPLTGHECVHIHVTLLLRPGSGKSTLLLALCFCFGSPLSHLGVKHLIELRCTDSSQVLHPTVAAHGVQLSDSALQHHPHAVWHAAYLAYPAYILMLCCTQPYLAYPLGAVLVNGHAKTPSALRWCRHAR